jgi:hypothetical protein
MKKVTKLCFGLLLMLALQLASCTKTTETPDDPNSGGNVTSTGTKMFWSNQSGSVITVKVDGGINTGTITKVYNQTSAPSCGSAGCYSPTLTTGYHTYTATDGTHSWSGSFTQTTGCNTLLLYW